MTFENSLTLRFPSNIRNIDFILSSVIYFAKQIDFSEGEESDIRTSTREAINNAISHGYPNRVGMIGLRCTILHDYILEIAIRDYGVGISDIEQARRPKFTTGGPTCRGMGFTLMESFMSNVEVSSSPGRGTTIYMRKVASSDY